MIVTEPLGANTPLDAVPYVFHTFKLVIALPLNEPLPSYVPVDVCTFVAVVIMKEPPPPPPVQDVAPPPPL